MYACLFLKTRIKQVVIKCSLIYILQNRSKIRVKVWNIRIIGNVYRDGHKYCDI